MMADRDDWRENIIQKLEKEIGVLRTNPLGIVLFSVLLIVLNLSTSDSDRILKDLIAFLVVFSPLVIGVTVLGAQKIWVNQEGIEIKKIFRRSRKYRWDDITEVYYRRCFPYCYHLMSLRTKNGLIYSNFFARLKIVENFVIIATFRVDGRCVAALKWKLRKFFETFDEVDN